VGTTGSLVSTGHVAVKGEVMELPIGQKAHVEDIRGMIGLGEADLELFRKHREFFQRHGGALIDFIAGVVSGHPESARVFEEGRGDLESLKRRLGVWLGEILEAHATEQFWTRQLVIGLEHIQRRIPNRQMVGLATRIREVVLKLAIEDLGVEEGVELYLAFQRMLDSVVALTTTVVDEGYRRSLLEATGFTWELAERLEAMTLRSLKAELTGEDESGR